MAFATLFDQIRAAYVADTPLSNALDDLNFVERAGSPVFPYGTYRYVSGAGIVTAGKAKLVDRLIQFNLFDDGPDMVTLAAAYDLLQAVYDPLLVQAGGRAYLFTWVGDWTFLGPDNIWQISCRYRVMDHPA